LSKSQRFRLRRVNTARKRSEKRTEFFTVVFYGLKLFLRKTAQFCATRCESEMAEAPSVRNSAQASENVRKNSFLNYKSATLPAELCRHLLWLGAAVLFREREEFSICGARLNDNC
jgi:hypothetical protein